MSKSVNMNQNKKTVLFIKMIIKIKYWKYKKKYNYKKLENLNINN